MEQIMELLKAMQERMETQIGSLASKMDANQAEMEAMQQKMDGWRANTAKNRATGRKVKPSTDVPSTALGEEEVAVHL
jgi:predicted RNase H-like nuclease (RuvC/YqgF family)